MLTRQEEPLTSGLRDGPSPVLDLPRAYARVDRTGNRARPTICEKSRSALIAPVYPRRARRSSVPKDEGYLGVDSILADLAVLHGRLRILDIDRTDVAD